MIRVVRRTDRRWMLRRRRRVKPRKYAKFYGRFETTTGKVKGYGFLVKVSDRLSGRGLSKLIRHTVGKLIVERALPVHRKGEAFPSFLELFHSKWIRIRKVLDYDVDMTYTFD